MSDGTELQENQEISGESKDVSEARQALDQAAFEPETAVEKAADFKQAEQVEAAVKEAVEAASTQLDAADEEPRTVEDAGAAAAREQDAVSDPEAAAETKSTVDGEPGSISEPAHQAAQDNRETEVIETILESNIDTTATYTEQTQDQVQAAQELVQEASQRQDEVAKNSTAPSAPPEGDPGAAAEDSQSPSPQYAANQAAVLDRTESQTEPIQDSVADMAIDPSRADDLRQSSEDRGGGLEADQAERTDQGSGKAGFGGSAAEPAYNYSSVTMSQGEVAQDSDWAAAGREEQAAPFPQGEVLSDSGAQAFKENQGAFQEMVEVAAGDEGGSLAIEAAPEQVLGEGSESEGLAKIDIQSQLQRQQQLIDMLHGVSSALQDTADSTDRKADEGSYQAETEGAAEGEDPVAAQAEGALQEIGDQAQLESMDLQNSLQKEQQLIQLMSNLSKMLEDSAMSVVRNIGGGEESAQDDPGQPADSDQSQGEEAALTDMSETNLSSLEDSMQKMQGVIQTTSTILKNIHDVNNALIENIRGAEGQDGDDPGTSGDALQKQLEDWEEQLSTIGDDAQPTEVDLSSFLEKQQGTINLLAGLTKTLTDTTSAVSHRLGLTQPPAVESADQEIGTRQSSLQGEIASTSEDWRSAAESNMIADPSTGEAIDPLEDQNGDIQEESTSAGSDQGSATDELLDRLGNLEATRQRLEMDIISLRDFIAHAPEGQFQNLLIHLPVPDGEGGYRLVPLQVPADVNGAANLLAQQEGFLIQIMGEIAQVQSQLESSSDGPPSMAGPSIQHSATAGQASSSQDSAQDNAIEDPRPNSGPENAG